MKFLYFTDTHIRGTNPKNRIDNFYQTLKDKFQELIEISKTENVDYILHGGDLFDRPDPSVSIVGDFAKIFNEFKAPIYIVSGNHDIFGHNPSTIDRTMLGLLCNLGILNLVNDKTIILDKDIRVQLTAAPYVYGMDSKENIERYIVKEKNPTCRYAIHLTHGFLVDKPFLKDVEHTLVSDIKNTMADITLCAHFHYGFDTVEIANKYFVNPGALVRISNSLAEMKRKPKAVIIELTDKIKLKEIYLKSALPGEEVLDRSEMERHKFKGIKINEFKEIIDSSVNLKDTDIFSLLTKIGENDSIGRDVIEEALKRVEQIQISGAKYT